MEKRVHLKGRLLAISSYVENSKIAADIGCDHGRLSVALLQSGKTEYLYACDISPDSLKKAELLRNKCGLERKMCILQADGMQALPVNPDTVIIAGMGGRLIADIIDAKHDTAEKAKNLILQPMRGVAQLREYLHENNYIIEHECLCKESGRLYQIISAHHSAVRQNFTLLPKGFYEFGEYMITHSDPLLAEYVSRLVKELEDAILCAEKGGKDPQELKQKLNTIQHLSLII